MRSPFLVGRKRRSIAAALAASCLLGSSLLSAQTPERAPETAVKAAFVYNFAKFVEWPAKDATRPLSIGVIGDEQFRDFLSRTVDGERVGGRPLVARLLSPDDPLDDCDVVFVASKAAEETRRVLERARGRRILTVGEERSFTDAGGIIALHVVNSRVRFSINLEAAARAELSISSQLLKLASDVRGGGN